MNKLYLNALKLILRKKTLSIFLALSAGISFSNAQQNVPVTGFNADAVANGIGAPSTSSTAATDGGVDDGTYVFIDGTYQYNNTCALATTNILPANNQITSSAVPGLVYQLQPYSGNNALRVPATGRLAGSGMLTLTTPVSAGALYLLCVAGGGQIVSGITVTVTFTDATTQVFSNRTAEDWCNTNTNANYTKITATNYNRIQTSTVAGCAGFGPCQYFAEMALLLDVANHGKQVATITVDKTTSTNVMNVFGVGMIPPCVVPSAQPTSLQANITSTGFIEASFSAAVPSASGYLVVRYPNNATPASPVSGTTYTPGQSLGTGVVIQASSATTFTANNLTPNTSYDFYVYSYMGPCSPSASNPSYLTANPLMLTMTTNACGGTMSGVLTVGPGQTFNTITAALGAISASGLSGHAILELVQSYDASAETFPISFRGTPCATSSASLTIRPHSNNTAPVIISSNSATATIDLNGARYITFDGRPGGVPGASKFLSIINTNPAGVAIRFTNDASQNNIKHCDVQGQNTSSTTSAASAQVGVISFGTANTTFLNGNDSNLISYCDIHGVTGSTPGFPAIAIASFGNNVSTPVSSWNDFITIDHCNIFDFFSATLASTAIKADGGSNRFVISNNHIYQTAARTYTAANNHRAFWLTTGSIGASGFQVINNFIGGNDSLGAGTYEMLGGGVGTNFWGMDINHAGTLHTSVQGNTITNISLTNTSTTGNIFRGIGTGNSGHVDIGNLTGNIIGSTTTNGAINLSNGSSGGTAYGIVNGGAAPDSVLIHNNTIAGITATSPTANTAVHINGIAVTSGNYCSINNNLVGSATNANSLYSANPVTTVAQSVYGIFVSTGTYNAVINNRVLNITNNTASTSTTTNTSYTRGIGLAGSTTSVVSGNTVRNVACGSISTGSNGTSPLVGIAVNTSNPSTITGNTVDSLVLMGNTTTNATNADGMLIGLNGSTPTHLVAKNFIHHIIVNRVGTTNAVINGMNIIGGSSIIVNNMIQLGLYTDGSSYDTSVVIRGLYLNNTTANNVFHNNVYIGGTAVLNNNKNTFAFARNAASGTHLVNNNVFVNARSNASTGGKHYQVFLSSANGLTLSNNVYFGTGTGSIFGSANNGTNDVATFASGWIAADVNGVSANPQFVNPNGGSVNSGNMVNLHINPSVSTPVEGSGLVIASVTDDYDGDNRSLNTPVDIGADAGLFTPIGMSVDSTTTAQVTSGLLIGANNQAIIAVKVYTKGAVSPLQVTALKLNTSGTSNVADLANAKVYYTGSNSTFGTGTPFGTAVTSPNGTFYVNGTQTLSVGVNYFWVAYDISSSATAGNFADARLDSVGISGNVNANILYGDPVGSRRIFAPLSGNYNIGASQSYTTITAALTDLNLLGVSGPVTFTLTNPTYSVANGETFPLVLGAYAGASATNTVTFIPDAGNTASIIDSVAIPLVRIDAGKYYRIDGRQGGTGMPKNIIIQNNDTLSGSALNLINDASFNTLRYAVFKGACTNPTIGVINIGTGATTGNDSNTFEYCNIGNANSWPATLVQARGSFDVTTKFNNGNIFRNNELFNFHKTNGESNAFKISKGNTDWTFTGNSFYLTTPRTFAQIHYTFNWNRIVDDASNTNDAMAAASLNNMIITGNYFGGSAAMCGGTPWTEVNSAGAFCSYLNMGDFGRSIVKNNIFTNFSITSTNASTGAPGAWNAIQFIGGLMDIDSNIIGSLTDTLSFSITGGNAGVVFPIVAASGTAGTHRINGNKVGGLKVGGSGAASVNLFGIHLSGTGTGVTYNIEYNNIGVQPLKTLASTNTTPQLNVGINSTTTANVNIRQNTVHNLYNEQANAVTTQTIGIRSTAGQTVISGNLVDSLYHQTGQTGTGANASVIGIALTSTTGNGLVERNTIHRLHSLNAADAVAVSGIYYSGGTNDIISRNLVHSLSTLSTSATSANTAIQVAGGTVRVQNNMIRLGIDAAGMAQTNTPVITGVSITGGNAKVFFNSVYIGGAGVTGASNTFALNRTSSGTDSIYNNIFMNERSGGTGNHYSIGSANATNLRANQNLYYNPAGTSLGLFGASTQAQISNWKVASGIDGNSNSGNPGFANATADMSLLDLHISGTTPVEGSGLLITGISDDYDGDNRNNVTPTDIGADAGNFTLSDIFAPVITYTLIGSDTVTSQLTLNNFARISDASNVDVSANIPRLYYKKITDNNTFGGNSQFDNGWKYVTATNTSSPFSFVIDYSIINGGAVVVTDTIQYFVAAQDVLNNVGASPSAGFSAAAVNSIFNAPSTPNYYRIKLNPLNGSYNVGSGQTAPNFATLSSAINTLNDVGVGSPVTFNLLDANYNTGTGEVFPLNINAFSGSSTINTVTIKPAPAVTSLIAGNAAAIFKLNGADNIIIDGSNTVNGTTRDLSIIDTSTSSALIWLASQGVNAGASNVTIKNTNLTGNSPTASNFGIFSAGTALGTGQTGAHNNNLTVLNNKIVNVGYGVYVYGVSTSKHNTVNISRNLIGDSINTSKTVGNIGIYAAYTDGITVGENTLLNIASTFITGGGPQGVSLQTGSVNATINNNIIAKVMYTGASGYGGKGIDINTGDANSNIEIRNNMVSYISGDGWAGFTGDAIVGIRLNGTNGNIRVYYNTVSIAPTSSGGTSTNVSAAFYAAAATTNLNVRNNIFVNPMVNATIATSKAYAIATDIAGTTAYTFNYNNYFVSGSQGMLGYKAGDFATIAAWRTATAQDANSKSTSVNFATATDLHLTGASNGDVLLAGTPIAGITTDIDGTTRSATSPYMGANEASTPLPVKLVTFTASAKREDVLVSWATANEINNKGFDVERSVDGKSFTKIEFVKGAGNSNRLTSYNFTDAYAFKTTNSTTLFYRLKQVDLNGKSTYSNTVTVAAGEEQQPTQVMVYPNPFETHIQVQLVATGTAPAEISITDVSGKLVASKQIAVNEGLNAMEIDQLSNLDKGIYFIRIIQNGTTSVQKVVKQ